MSKVYYCLYLVNGKLTVIEVQDFDIPDYDIHKFVMTPHADGPRTFDSKHDAIQHLNRKYRIEYIDPEYLTPFHERLRRE
jgi:hypothetical protein